MMFTKIFTAAGLFAISTFFAPVASQKACKSTLDIVVSSSGPPGAGFDNDKKDFDILRELVVLAGLADQLGPNGLKDITVFAPWDEAFFRLAKDLSDFVDDDSNAFKPRGYDEEGAFNYIAGVLTSLAGGPDELVGLVTNILLYHVADEEVVFKQAAKKGQKKVTVTTLFDGLDIPVVMAMPNSNAKMRIKMKHNADPTDFPYPKVQNKKFDIRTCNGRLNVIKNVLIPLDV